MVCYTRNREDVMLQRAFAGIEQGFYLDVGAFTPVFDSNTYGLYTRGWRGICIEPQVYFDDDWRRLRPRDTLLHVLAGAEPGERKLYEFLPHAQLATTSAEVAAAHRGVYGTSTVSARPIPVRTLCEVLDEHLPPGQPLHLASIDVEGAEAEALQGLDLRRHRPWVLVLEAVFPGRPQPNHAHWEPAVLAAGYEPAYFDGVNRFYVAAEHAGLLESLRVPPNVWDDFVYHAAEQRIRELEAAVLDLHASLQASRETSRPK